jgi:hypothetical protein
MYRPHIGRSFRDPLLKLFLGKSMDYQGIQVPQGPAALKTIDWMVSLLRFIAIVKSIIYIYILSQYMCIYIVNCLCLRRIGSFSRPFLSNYMKRSTSERKLLLLWPIVGVTLLNSWLLLRSDRQWWVIWVRELLGSSFPNLASWRPAPKLESASVVPPAPRLRLLPVLHVLKIIFWSLFSLLFSGALAPRPLGLSTDN